MNRKKTISLLFSVLLFTSCGNKESTPNTATPSTETPTTETVVKKKFENIQFSSSSVLYDGKEHQLSEATGYPEGTQVSYEGRNSYIDVGNYTAKVKLAKEGYEDYQQEATLTILPIEFSGIEYKSKSVTYDGKDHISDVQLIGFLPADTTKNEVIKDEKGNIVTSAIQVGKYNYSLTLQNKNYKEITLTATLTIKGTKKETPIIHVGNTTYFANGLDHYYLYSYSSETGVKRSDFSTPRKLKETSGTSLLSVSDSLLSDSAKEFSATENKVLYTDSNITDFVKYSDTVYYYSKNGLSETESGIYKVTNSDTEEPVTERIFTGKSDKLEIAGNYLYFENKGEDGHIFKIDLSTKTTTLVLNAKVHEYVLSSDYLYCTVNGKINDYIGKLKLSSTSTEAEKMTDAAGECLNLLGDDLYYNYTDLYGYIDDSKKGIYKINTKDNSTTQILNSTIINAFDMISSSSLVYIDSNTLHPYQYNISTKSSTDCMPGFVPAEDKPYNLGGKTVNYQGKIYYLDMFRGKTLNCYDEESKTITQLTDNKVMDFSIFGDMLYFNQVTTLTNNDLYSINLKAGGDTRKITSNDTRNIISDGTYLYGTHYNFAGASGGIFRMKPDGSEYVKFSEVNGAKNFRIKDNKLYFINSGTAQDNGNIEYYNLSDINVGSAKLKSTVLSKNIKNVKQFEFDDNNIYYIYNGTIDNSIRRTDFTSLAEGTKIASNKTNPSEFLLDGNDIYYYSYAVSSAKDAGFYKVSKNAAKDGTQEKLASYDSKYYATAFAKTDSSLYFLNYIPKMTLGDGHFYKMSLNTKEITKVN